MFLIVIYVVCFEDAKNKNIRNEKILKNALLNNLV